MPRNDSESLYKQWFESHGVKLEDIVLRKAAAWHFREDPNVWFSLVDAIRKALTEAWDAGWDSKEDLENYSR